MSSRIYYSDGRSLDTLDLPLHRRVGVIAVAEPDPDHNWSFHVGKDWYLFLTSGWWIGVDDAGLQDYLLNRLDEMEIVLMGRTVPSVKYQEIIDRMMQECRPEKTGWHPGER